METKGVKAPRRVGKPPGEGGVKENAGGVIGEKRRPSLSGWAGWGDERGAGRFGGYSDGSSEDSYSSALIPTL